MEELLEYLGMVEHKRSRAIKVRFSENQELNPVVLTPTLSSSCLLEPAGR